jgi:hypothetical protein
VEQQDSQWPAFVKEVDDFLNSTALGKGINLFKAIEAKILEELGPLIEERKKGLAVAASGMLQGRKKLLN